MDDDMSICRDGKNVGVRHECQCASALKLVKMYSVASCMQACQTTAYSQLWLIILLTVGLSRGPRSELCLILVNLSNIYVQSDLIVTHF